MPVKRPVLESPPRFADIRSLRTNWTTYYLLVRLDLKFVTLLERGLVRVFRLSAIVAGIAVKGIAIFDLRRGRGTNRSANRQSAGVGIGEHKPTRYKCHPRMPELIVQSHNLGTYSRCPLKSKSP